MGGAGKTSGKVAMQQGGAGGGGAQTRQTNAAAAVEAAKLTRESVIAQGGSINLGTVGMEIIRLYNPKSGGYDGPFGKTVEVSGAASNGQRVLRDFRSFENAQKFMVSVLKNGHRMSPGTLYNIP